MDYQLRQSLPRFTFDFTTPSVQLFKVCVDTSTYLYVIGDCVNGSYEWVCTGPSLRAQSNRGYTDQSIALRDGLCSYHGLPDEEVLP